MSTQNYTPIDDFIRQSTSRKSPPVTVPSQKENEPLKTENQQEPTEKPEVQEIVEKETVDDEEVKPYIHVENKTLVISPEVEKAGLQASQQPVNFPTYQTEIPLPLTDEEIVADMKQPITSAKRWLATFALYLLNRSHLTIKVVKGHIMRIVKK